MGKRRRSNKGSRANSVSKKRAIASSNQANEIIDDPSEYVVEEVIGKRFQNGRCMMLLKWQDYPLEMATWEPLQNCANCLLLVDEFECKLNVKRQEKLSRSKLTKTPNLDKSKANMPAPSQITDSTPTTSKYAINQGLQNAPTTGVVKPISRLPPTTKAAKKMYGGKKQ